MLGLGFAPQIQQLKAMLQTAPPPPAAVQGGADAYAGSKQQQQGQQGQQRRRRRVQVGLFTATMPEALGAEVAALWLHRPERIRVSAAAAASISKSVTQVWPRGWTAPLPLAPACSPSTPHNVRLSTPRPPAAALWSHQVVQVCAEHKKPAKLARHLAKIQEGGKGQRNPPRILVFANRRATLLHRL